PHPGGRELGPVGRRGLVVLVEDPRQDLDALSAGRVPRVVAGVVVVVVCRPVVMPVEPPHQLLAPSSLGSSSIEVMRNSSPETTTASKSPQPPQANTGMAPTSVTCPHERHRMRAGTDSTLIREPA